MSDLQPGRYRHFKGRDYEVLRVVTHSETQESLVLYRTLYGETKDVDLWVRPVQMFSEEVQFEGKQVPRFRFIETLSEKLKL